MSRVLRAACLILVVSLPWTFAHAQSGKSHRYRTFHVTFSLPQKFSSPASIGLDALGLYYPAKAKLGSEVLEIAVVSIGKDLRASLNNNESEIFAYVSSVYFGASGPDSTILEPRSVDQLPRGRLYHLSIPKKSTLYLYLLPLSDGRDLAIGFRAYESAPEGLLEETRATLFRTLKEVH